jgi:hypothetical protein
MQSVHFAAARPSTIERAMDGKFPISGLHALPPPVMDYPVIVSSPEGGLWPAAAENDYPD